MPFGSEVIPCAEVVVAVELEEASMPVVRARARQAVEDAAGREAALGAQAGRLDLKRLHALDRLHTDGGIPERLLIEDAVRGPQVGGWRLPIDSGESIPRRVPDHVD